MSNTAEAIAKYAKSIGVTEIAPLDIRSLEFEDWVRDICKNSCRSYNTSWACPPAFGTLEECRKRCEAFQNMLLFNRRYEIEDSFDWEGMSSAMHNFKELSIQLESFVAPIVVKILVLTSEGCEKCQKCTWPDAPCRFPDKLHHSLEGYGFNVSKLAEKAGLHYIGGPNTVTFFGAVLYNE